MGNTCNSSESTSVVTAKLILQDGRLQEFPNPIRVSQVLERNPNSFICSSDDMDLDGLLCAIDDEDQLQLGELYFALPLSWLNSPLRTAEMGALAIKAAQALNMDINGGKYFPKIFCGCGINIKKVDPLLLPNNRVAKTNLVVANGGSTAGGGSGGFVVRRRKRRDSAGRRISGCRFKAKLTVILEEPDD